MAKRVVARAKDKQAKTFAKVIRAVRVDKTKAYSFKEEMVPMEEVQKILQKK